MPSQPPFLSFWKFFIFYLFIRCCRPIKIYWRHPGIHSSSHPTPQQTSVHIHNTIQKLIRYQFLQCAITGNFVPRLFFEKFSAGHFLKPLYTCSSFYFFLPVSHYTFCLAQVHIDRLENKKANTFCTSVFKNKRIKFSFFSLKKNLRARERI